VNDGLIHPGLQHTLIVSDAPLDKQYRRINGVDVDENIKDVGTEVIEAMIANNLRYISLRRNVIVEGRSWEMAAAMAIMGVRGVYSGEIVKYVHPNSFLFGPVPAIDIKRKIVKNLITYENLPMI
jgi:hypothetical protein